MTINTHQYWGSLRSEWFKKDDVPQKPDAPWIQKVEKELKGQDTEDSRKNLAWLQEVSRSLEGTVFPSLIRRDPYSFEIYNLDLSRCDSCGEVAIWLAGRLIHPQTGPVGIPSQDMPASVRKLFEEAGRVYSSSPRASVALLRLAMQVLLKELGQDGKDINKDINALYKQGLSPGLTKVMHSLRIIGNESVHPGVISVDDDPSIAATMFRLLNEIVEQMITRPREQQELWDMLPENKRAPIEAILKPKE
ncbi:DUF4145 domain-containing protein [Pseudorhodobacter ferrugineus]|uniref:DUF4145 domain-containing protein n=1 Tax=Pseudorhodobacter ferrugineus TaxID=77008 RepID=UPI0018CE7B87|nr:DUF4145 domain-containing protein [Pseudorhodobacter ferrugineus]